MDQTKANVHAIISRRARLGTHELIADMESSPCGLSNVEAKVVRLSRRER